MSMGKKGLNMIQYDGITKSPIKPSLTTLLVKKVFHNT